MYLKYVHKHKTRSRCVCVCMSVYLHTSMCKRFSRCSYIIMYAHLMHGCTDFGQKKQLSAPLPPPPQLLSNFVFLGMAALLMIRYVVYYSCLLIEKSLRVTSSTSSSSLPLSPSSSLPFWSHDVVSLSESGCVVQSQICHWSETEKKDYCSQSPLEIIQHTSKSDHFPLWNMVNGCDLLQLVMFFLYSAEWPSVIFLKRFSISITFHLLLLACYCIIFLYNSHKFSFIVSVCVHVFREEEQAKQQRQRFSISECIIHISWCHVGSTFTYLGWLGW